MNPVRYPENAIESDPRSFPCRKVLTMGKLIIFDLLFAEI